MILNIIAHLLMSSQYKQIHANSCICIQREIFFIRTYLNTCEYFYFQVNFFLFPNIYLHDFKRKKNSPLLNVLLEEGFYLFIFVFI